MPRIPKSKVIINEISENVGGDLKTTIRKTKDIAKRYTPKADTIKKVGRIAKIVAPIVVNPVTGIAMASTQLKKRQVGVLPPKVRNLLAEIGNQQITSMKIVRTPIETAVQGLLSIISLGSYNKAVKNANYDSMFHLALFLNDSITLDKQAVISMVKGNPIKDKSEVFTVALGADQPITFQKLLDNTREYMGNSAFSNYDSRRNNCQDFVMAILKSNDLNSPQAQSFVKQDAEAIFQKMPSFTDKVAGFFTDVGAVTDQLIEGEGFYEEWIPIGEHYYNFPVTRGGQIETTMPQVFKPITPDRFHKGEYYAQKDANGNYTVNHQVTSRIVGDQLSYDKANELMDRLEKETIQMKEQEFKNIIEKENEKKKELIKKPKKEKKVINKSKMQTWREFWSQACKGKKFESRSAVNNYMKEMAKKYREMKNKSK